MMLARRFQTSHLFAFVASASATRSALSTRMYTLPASTAASAFSSPALHHRRHRSCSPRHFHMHQCQYPSPFISRKENLTRQQMSFFGVEAEGGFPRIDRADMAEIIEDVANSSREESGYVIIDVRGHDEVQSTGKLNEVVETLPLPYIAQGALAMEEEDFEENFGFAKPGLDETIVFTCKAGIRSYQAGQLAKMAGYSNVVDYMGGANEWFS